MYAKPSFNALGNNPANFVNAWGSSNAPMTDAAQGTLTKPIKPRKEPYYLDLTFYYSEDKDIYNAKLKEDKYLSSQVNVFMVSAVMYCSTV